MSFRSEHLMPTLTPLHTHGIFHPDPCESFPDVLLASTHAPLPSVFYISQLHPYWAAYNCFPSLREHIQSSHCNLTLAGSQTSWTAILSPPHPLTLHKVILDSMLFLDRTNRLLDQDLSTCSSSCIEVVSTDFLFGLSQNFLIATSS